MGLELLTFKGVAHRQGLTTHYPPERDPTRLSAKPKGTSETLVDDFEQRFTTSPSWTRMHPLNDLMLSGFFRKEKEGLNGQKEGGGEPGINITRDGERV